MKKEITEMKAADEKSLAQSLTQSLGALNALTEKYTNAAKRDDTNQQAQSGSQYQSLRRYS